MIKSVRDPAYVALIDWLVSVREMQGLTVRQLAEKLGEDDHSIIVKIETKVRKISATEYYGFCKALNVDTSEGYEAMEKASNLKFR